MTTLSHIKPNTSV